jgi:hypothetical protein
MQIFKPWLQERPDYQARAVNIRNSLEAFGLIWFVVGNMWLFGDDDNSCRNPQHSPVYNLCLAMLIINYIQICLPCILAILLIPVFLFLYAMSYPFTCKNAGFYCCGECGFEDCSLFK